MSDVIETVDVAVPVRTAYNQWTQFEEFPRFMEGVEHIDQVSDTLTHWKIKIGGVEREFDAEITEQRPDERVAWHSVGGTGHAGVVTFHRLDDVSTRVTLQLETAPEGVVETLGDKLGLVKHRAKADMERFKEYIESRGSETGGFRDAIEKNTVPGDTMAGGAGATGGDIMGSVVPDSDSDLRSGYTDVDPAPGRGGLPDPDLPTDDDPTLGGGRSGGLPGPAPI